jgi:hypothetical protein
MPESLTTAGRYREPFWKFALIWATGSFVGVLLFHGFRPSRSRLEEWLGFVAAGVLANGFVRLVDPWLRKFKAYRSLEARLGLNRNGSA